MSIASQIKPLVIKALKELYDPDLTETILLSTQPNPNLKAITLSYCLL